MGVRSRGTGTPAASPRLFDPSELDLRPTGVGRMVKLAARSVPRLTDRERRREEDRRTMNQLRTWGADLARRFGLAWAALDPEEDGVTEHYGICYEDGVIRIRLRHATTGRILKESSLVDTLCHELAHLKHLNHGLRFRKLYAEILSQARELGYYRPGPEESRPRQAALFEGCGSSSGSRARKSRR